MIESPSPKKFAWVTGYQTEDTTLPPLCTRLEKWLNARRQYLIPSSTLSTILRTPAEPLQPIPYDNDGYDSSYVRKSEHCLPSISALGSIQEDQDIHSHSGKAHVDLMCLEDKDFDDIESEIRKLSLVSRPGSLGNDPFFALLKECGQSAPSTLFEVFSKLWSVPSPG